MGTIKVTYCPECEILVSRGELSRVEGLISEATLYFHPNNVNAAEMQEVVRRLVDEARQRLGAVVWPERSTEPGGLTPVDDLPF